MSYLKIIEKYHSQLPHIYDTIMQDYWKQICLNPNLTIEFVEAHPDYPWSSKYLSGNPIFTIEYIEAHPEKEWDWRYISQNPNLRLQHLEKYDDKLDWHYILDRTDLVKENLEQFMKMIDRKFFSTPQPENIFITDTVLYNASWYWHKFIKNPAIPFEIKRKYFDYHKNWEIIASIRNLPSDFIIENIEHLKEYHYFILFETSIPFDILKEHFVCSEPEQMDPIAMNRGVSFNDILSHPEYNWNWEFVSMNPNIKLYHVLRYPDLAWDWEGLGYNANFNVKVIDANPDLPWDWKSICYNITDEIWFLDKYGDKEFNYEYLSMNHQIPLWYFKKYIDKDWNWTRLSEHPNITMEFIEAHPEKPWDYMSISLNPNLTFEFLERHMDENWYWMGIVSNHYQKSERLLEVIEKRNAKLTEIITPIQRHFLERYWNPANELCQKRLMRELEEIHEMFPH